MSFQFKSSKKLLELMAEHKISTIAEMVIKAETELTGHSEADIRGNMKKRLTIMKESAILGRENPKKSKSGMVGGDSKKMEGIRGEKIFLSEVMRKGVEYSIGVMESNARMGKIVAAPTAGSSGILPGAILAVQEEWNLSEETAGEGLLTAAGVGIIIANIGTFSAAEAGCQAEVGTSSAMAAAAVSAMRGLSPEQCLNAASLALKNFLGLACDPIDGLVEVPCVKRNGMGVVQALTASDMTFAGITSIVPFDEVVEAMNNIASHMNENIRETSKGGLSVTPTAKRIACRGCGDKESCHSAGKCAL